MKVGVVADTHGFVDPELRARLAGVGCILHAGDVDSQQVLDEFGLIAPVYAVRGNVDPADLNLPFSRRLNFEGVQIEMLHILPEHQSKLEQWSVGRRAGKIDGERRESFLKNFASATRVVIFGHSHEPCLIALDGVLFFNPGSAGKKRFSLPRCYGLLDVSPPNVRAIVNSLEGDAAVDMRDFRLPA